MFFIRFGEFVSVIKILFILDVASLDQGKSSERCKSINFVEVKLEFYLQPYPRGISFLDPGKEIEDRKRKYFS